MNINNSLYNMDKSLKSFLTIFGTVIILFFGVLLYLSKKGKDENLAYNFAGVVESVTYDIKDFPTVTVCATDYYLSAGYYFDRQIEKGDYLKKEKGKTTYTLTKSKTGEVILFDN